MIKILRRPSISINDFRQVLFKKNLLSSSLSVHLIEEAFLEAETIIKYDGYIKRQTDQIKRLSSINRKKIPCHFNYEKIKGLSLEAREKLVLIRPETVGQAMRISGGTPSDASVLSVYLHK